MWDHLGEGRGDERNTSGVTIRWRRLLLAGLDDRPDCAPLRVAIAPENFGMDGVCYAGPSRRGDISTARAVSGQAPRG
ncbi:MAG: hypothetical protein AVDCRST_MAG87-1234 [uncultured Thermomicrobiales bacterium]|uniref:Uncharacterized protein n=1 Tax=uncultured Thermomicrobiales bacterium TaxID=1645740 RepID=A0A6J4UQZ8_9BACT|nr:MAG: hypothetical protein AVDCRST_MAG87-1234 [uncultured Thermomicrobiales bacterium]